MQGLVTVFGGSGFIGAQVVRALAKRGLRVRIAVRRPGLAYRARTLGDVGQIELVQANLRNPASIDRALDGAEACINLVGILYESGRQRFQTLHARGAEEVALAAAARGITNFVQMSALGADPHSPSRYARTKGMGEMAVRAAIRSAVIVRPSVVFGADDSLFNRFASLASILPVVPLPGGGSTRFQPVFVGDLAAAIANAVTDSSAAGKTFEIGGPRVYTYRELIELTLAEIHKSRPLLPLPWPVASLIGSLAELPTKLLPIPPVLTADQVELLKSDAVPRDGALGLAALGVTAPTAVEAILPTYLYRYRRGGQFADTSKVSPTGA
ncbi:MAG: NAD-dependent epimerase/dehydratase [Caulobacteraceae bacterium]|nr:NAD-dependent epimerase/dehydratase [Caulobacteraceae bacterium]